MRSHHLALLTLLSLSPAPVLAQETGSSAAHPITLSEAVELALKHNHVVRIAQYAVEEKEHAKDVARSGYFPVLRNDSTFLHSTDSQFIGIPAGGLGMPDGFPVPPRSVILNQGGHDFTISGTELTLPLAELFKIKSGNDAARAEVSASRGKASAAQNEIAFNVRQLYYRILIAESRRSAIEAKIHASEELQSERVQQVKYGNTLQTELIESQAQSLQSKQELLSTEVQLTDLRMQFNDVIGFPLDTALELDPEVPAKSATCEREECLKRALESNPDIEQGRAEVKQAEAGVRAAKREYIPDLEAFAKYTYNNNVPFLARNFGTFGVHFGYDVFDGRKKHSILQEREAELAQAKENLARVSDEVEVRVKSAYNNLERAQQMVEVSEKLLSLRSEAQRISAQQMEHGALLRSQAQSAVAQELEAKTALLQSRLDEALAYDELVRAVGEKP